MNCEVRWKNSQGTNGNNVPPRAQDPMAAPSVQEMVFKKAWHATTVTTFKNKRAKWYTFFFAPVSRLFAPVSRVFAPVSRKTLGSCWIISGDIRCKMSISRMSKPIECKALFCVSTEFIVQLCHAAMPQADEFSPWVFSTDNPMHQIAEGTCTSFHGLAMFQTFHSMWNESDFRPGGGIRCKYLKTKACIQAWMETRMSSTLCAAALLVDWPKAIREKIWHKWIAVRQSHHLCPR